MRHSPVDLDSLVAPLRHFEVPEAWDAQLLLIPEVCLQLLLDHIQRYDIREVLELGTGFGATSCTIASYFKAQGAGRITTVDRHLHQPVNVEVLRDYLGLDGRYLNSVVEPLGYNWFLADLLGADSSEFWKDQMQDPTNGSGPKFDLVFLDGAHEWEPDALAFELATRLLKPGGWIVLDDLDFRLRQIEDRLPAGQYSQRELDSFQVRMIYERLLQSHPSYGFTRAFPEDRMAWGRKLRPIISLKGIWDRIRYTRG